MLSTKNSPDEARKGRVRSSSPCQDPGSLLASPLAQACQQAGAQGRVAVGTWQLCPPPAAEAPVEHSDPNTSLPASPELAEPGGCSDLQHMVPVTTSAPSRSRLWEMGQGVEEEEGSCDGTARAAILLAASSGRQCGHEGSSFVLAHPRASKALLWAQLCHCALPEPRSCPLQVQISTQCSARSLGGTAGCTAALPTGRMQEQRWPRVPSASPSPPFLPSSPCAAAALPWDAEAAGLCGGQAAALPQSWGSEPGTAPRWHCGLRQPLLLAALRHGSARSCRLPLPRSPAPCRTLSLIPAPVLIASSALSAPVSLGNFFLFICCRQLH